MPTGINWCDETVNSVIGCQRISPGCANCYAATMAHMRVNNLMLPQYTRNVANWDGTTTWVTGQVEKLFKWRGKKYSSEV